MIEQIVVAIIGMIAGFVVARIQARRTTFPAPLSTTDRTSFSDAQTDGTSDVHKNALQLLQNGSKWRSLTLLGIAFVSIVSVASASQNFTVLAWIVVLPLASSLVAYRWPTTLGYAILFLFILHLTSATEMALAGGAHKLPKGATASTVAIRSILMIDRLYVGIQFGIPIALLNTAIVWLVARRNTSRSAQ